MTIKQLGATVEYLRKLYPFTEDADVNLFDLVSMSMSNVLTLREIDKETGIEVVLSHELVDNTLTVKQVTEVWDGCMKRLKENGGESKKELSDDSLIPTGKPVGLYDNPK